MNVIMQINKIIHTQ